MKKQALAKVKITVICNNEAGKSFQKEHGLSLLVQTGTKAVLLDSGQGQTFAHNCQQAGIDPFALTYHVISHGHYDHTGALADLLQNGSLQKIFYHPDIFLKRYSLHPGKPAHLISVPRPALKKLAAYKKSGRITVTKPHNITACIGVTGPIPRINPYEDTGGPFFLDQNRQKTDLINDDQALWLDTVQGLIIICGCCHAGLINTVNYIRKISGRKQLLAVMGGLHLKAAVPARLEQTAAFLKKSRCRRIIPLHCTGKKATDFLKQQLKDRITELRAGDSITLPQ
ncbi:MAG TPA: MBL fold metallo-hydrolase [Spirochaetota bacterium]|nr:MBL fold metallo-hydrolase [Spirochaetota bacterium]